MDAGSSPPSPISSSDGRFRRLLPGPMALRQTPSARTVGDRFIPMRSEMDFNFAHYMITEGSRKKENVAESCPSKAAYRKLLADALNMNRTRILVFRLKPPMRRLCTFQENSFPDASYFQSGKPRRSIPQSPERTLEAAGIVDDDSVNLLDWSSRNIIAIALRRSTAVYLFDASNRSISELPAFDDDNVVTSVGWAPDGRTIAIGLNSSDVELWDPVANRKLRTLHTGHRFAVGSLSWNNNILTTGGKDGLIVNNDVRMENHIVGTYRGHRRAVGGLKWSESGTMLASGGNDKLLHIWDISMASSNSPRQWLHRFDDHLASVKALAWCSFKNNLLASGGGAGDRCIKLWNTQIGDCVNSIDTGSEVWSLLWSHNERELLSSHGSPQNQLTLWKYPSMVKMADLTGHSKRVLFTVQSPDGCTVASAAGDETLKFWNVFGATRVAKPAAKITNASPFSTVSYIR